MNASTLAQTEKLACAQILDLAKEFYRDPKNQKAFEAWKQRSIQERKEPALKGVEIRDRPGGKTRIRP